MAGLLKRYVERELAQHCSIWVAPNDILRSVPGSCYTRAWWCAAFNMYFSNVQQNIISILMCFERVGLPCDIAIEHVLPLMYCVAACIRALEYKSRGVCDRARGVGVCGPGPSRLILREGTELSIENIIQENDFTFMYIGNLDSFIGGDC